MKVKQKVKVKYYTNLITNLINTFKLEKLGFISVKTLPQQLSGEGYCYYSFLETKRSRQTKMNRRKESVVHFPADACT